MKKILFICLTLILTSCGTAQVKKSENSNAVPNKQQSASFDINELLKKQVLLTNFAKFKKNRTLEGASGFLIKYKNSIYGITAKHLLGEAGGIEPEIIPSDLANNFISWEMSPRVVTDKSKETIKVDVNDLNYPNSMQDILMLNAISNNSIIEPLIPSFDLPAEGETLYIVGCPYSEAKCRQNYYKAKFLEYDENESLLIAEFNSKISLSGFSGAPVLNSKGNVVGVLVGGGGNLVTATHIKEIEKIR